MPDDLQLFKPEEQNQSGSQSHEKKKNFIVRWNLKVRKGLTKLFRCQGLAAKIFWLTIVNGIALGVLVATIIHHFNSGSPEIEWCDGVGFLWIIYAIVYFFAFFNVFAKYAGPLVLRCLRPLISCTIFLLNRRICRYAIYLTLLLIILAHVVIHPGKSGRRGFSFLGIIVFLFFGYIFSKYPAHVKWRPVFGGMLLQFIFGILTIQFEVGRFALDCIGSKVATLLKYTEEGTAFVFNYLAKPENNIQPVFAFSVLPVIYFLGFIINILSYFGALQWFIIKLSSVIRIALGTTVCESVHAIASIFLGMTEAPLLIQHYLKDLTKSEICSILCAGWATVAGSVLAAYIRFGVKASNLIAASIMSAPASLAYSKLLYPETEISKTTVDNIVLHKEEATNFLEAASKGALNGILIIGSIIANLVAFLAFIALVDGLLGWFGSVTGFEQLSFQFIASKIFYPISFLLGVDVESLEDVAYLLGIKVVANEFQAYEKLGELIRTNQISERSEAIATYALCGFSNLGSIGITVGTLAVMEPSQTAAITQVALRAFIAANIVCLLTGCVAGCFID